jgi:hypothetical protein
MSANVPHVSICIASGDHWLAKFGQSLVSVVVGARTAAVKVNLAQGCYVGGNRQKLAELALEEGASHILTLDVDMVYPHFLIDGLLAHDKPIVGLNYLQRHLKPLKTVAFRPGGYVWTEPDSTGLEEVEFTGAGGMLIKREVLEAVPKPWFRQGWSDEHQREVGEDVFFCRKAKEHGFPTLIDHDLSKEVAHLGYLPFTFDLAWGGPHSGA